MLTTDYLIIQISPVISIVFNMIIIGVGMASDRFLSNDNPTTQQNTTTDIRSLERAQHSASSAFRLGRMANSSADGHELKSIAVHITQQRETVADRYSGAWGGGAATSDADAETEQTRCSLEHGKTGGPRCRDADFSDV